MVDVHAIIGVGDDEGDVVGADVGFAVGDPVGRGVGARVGSAVGESVQALQYAGQTRGTSPVHPVPATRRRQLAGSEGLNGQLGVGKEVGARLGSAVGAVVGEAVVDVVDTT
jgi:hypothetical protein